MKSSPGIEVKEVKSAEMEPIDSVLSEEDRKQYVEGLYGKTTSRHVSEMTNLPHSKYLKEIRTFESLEMAQGFVSGIEYAEDSAIRADLCVELGQIKVRIYNKEEKQ